MNEDMQDMLKEPSLLEQMASQEINEEKNKLRELRKEREEMAKKLRDQEDN
jgi:hypothetical protein